LINNPYNPDMEGANSPFSRSPVSHGIIQGAGLLTLELPSE